MFKHSLKINNNIMTPKSLVNFSDNSKIEHQAWSTGPLFAGLLKRLLPPQPIVGSSFLVILAHRYIFTTLPWGRGQGSCQSQGQRVWLPLHDICFCSQGHNIAAMYLKLHVYVIIVISFQHQPKITFKSHIAYT